MIKLHMIGVAMDVAHQRGADGGVHSELLFQDAHSGIMVGVLLDSNGVRTLKLLLDGKKPIEIAMPGQQPLPRL